VFVIVVRWRIAQDSSVECSSIDSSLITQESLLIISESFTLISSSVP
jgi:hypothetical protein